MRKGMYLALCAAALNAAATCAFAQSDVIQFKLAVNPKFVDCLGRQGGPAPEASVTVRRGKLNDTLFLRLSHIRPNLAFDLFTVQNSTLGPDGQPNPAVANVGLAWYQSDIEANNWGDAEVEIKTILLDQIFGVDQGSQLPPTNTFHVGFWFNDPKDAAACGFDVNKPTPFNGEHHAGPLAMISLPNEKTKLGPLCTNPNSDGTCHP